MGVIKGIVASMSATLEKKKGSAGTPPDQRSLF
jgi:hypothetical protein